MIPVDNHCERSYRFPFWLPEIPRRIRLWTRAQYRRARYGVAPQDTWSFDTYLPRVIANGLTQLADTSHRCRGPEGNPNGEPCGHGEPACTDDWYIELRRAAEDFAQLADFHFIHDRTTEAKAEEIRKRAFAWLSENFHTLWD